MKSVQNDHELHELIRKNAQLKLRARDEDGRH